MLLATQLPPPAPWPVVARSVFRGCRFFVRLAAAIEGARTFPDLLEHALLFAHEAIEEHAVLQKILETEPERLLPTLTVESWRLRQG